MDKEEIQNVLQEIFRDVLDNNTLVLNDQLTAKTVEGWDSLTHIGIITAIENQYKIRFSLGEIEGLKSVADIIETIQKKHK